MKTILRYLLALIVVLNIGWTTKTSAATIYPIELTAQLLPPYSNCLGNYMSGEMDRVNIMALMKDITLDASNKPLSFDIQLHMTVRQGSQVYLEAQTRANNPITFSLQRDGVIKRLENAGRLLAPGVADVKYAKFKENGYCLPEGGYEFVFQAFDNNNPTLKLSAPVSFYVYLNENEPPMLVSPINSACVSNKLGVVNFMWMERSVPMISSSKKFHLSIKEVPEGVTDLEMAFNSGQEVYSDDNIPGTLTMKSVPVTAGRFQTGRTYVWKIRAFDNQTPTSTNADNSNTYKNNGWSELGVFRYDHCLDNEPIEIEEEEKECDDKSANPTIIYVDENGNAPGTVYWIVETPADSFRVEYTLASDKIGFWTKSSVATNDARKGIIEENVLQPELVEKYNGKTYYTFPIASLDKGKEYLVRVSSVKNKKDKNQKSELDSNGNAVVDCHSKADSATFKLPKISIGAENEEDEECRSEVPQLLCQEDCDPEKAPQKGDYISANGVNVKVLSISQSKTANGHTYYSGEGVTYLPFLDNVVGAYMQFTDIRISCANELLEGKIVTVYREDANFSLDLNEILNDNFTGTGPAPQQETFAEAKTTEEIETGRAAFVEEDGKQNLYTKSPDGTVVYVGEKAQCDEYNENDLDDGAGMVMFSRMANDKLTPFDYNAGKFTNNQITRYYESYGTYQVPWIAMVQGKTTTIKATYEQGSLGESVDVSKIYFVCKTKKTAVKLNSRLVGSNEWEITIFGDVPEQSLNIFAIYEPSTVNEENKEDNCKEIKTIGKARVASMKYREQKLLIIPTDGIAVNTDAIQKTLDEIYEPLGVKFTVEKDDNFESNYISTILDDGMDVTDHSVFKDESKHMLLLQAEYKMARPEKIDEKTAYLFVLPFMDGYPAGGIMPLNKGVGYVFVNGGDEYANGQTVAHELGHGLYSFEHSFNYGPDQGTTDNLMDYNNPQGQFLTVWQWNLISTHKTYTIPFMTSDEDAMINPIVKCALEGTFGFLLTNFLDSYDENKTFTETISDMIEVMMDNKLSSVIELGSSVTKSCVESLSKQMITQIINSILCVYRNCNKKTGYAACECYVENITGETVGLVLTFALGKLSDRNLEKLAKILKKTEIGKYITDVSVETLKRAASHFIGGKLSDLICGSKEEPIEEPKEKEEPKKNYSIKVEIVHQEVYVTLSGNSELDRIEIYGDEDTKILKDNDVEFTYQCQGIASPNCSVGVGKCFYRKKCPGYVTYGFILPCDDIIKYSVYAYDQEGNWDWDVQRDCGLSFDDLLKKLIDDKKKEKKEKKEEKEECNGIDLFVATSTSKIEAQEKLAEIECKYGFPQCSNWEKVSETEYKISPKLNGKFVDGLLTIVLNDPNDLTSIKSVELNPEVAKNLEGEIIPISCDGEDKSKIIKKINDNNGNTVFKLKDLDLHILEFFTRVVNRSIGSITGWTHANTCNYNDIFKVELDTWKNPYTGTLSSDISSCLGDDAEKVRKKIRETIGDYNFNYKNPDQQDLKRIISYLAGLLSNMEADPTVIKSTMPEESKPDYSNLLSVYLCKLYIRARSAAALENIPVTIFGNESSNYPSLPEYFRNLGTDKPTGCLIDDLINKHRNLFDSFGSGAAAKFKDEFKEAGDNVLKKFNEDLIKAWNVFASRDDNGKLKPIIRKKIENLEAVNSILKNSKAGEFGFTEEFVAKAEGTQDFSYKELLNTCESFANAYDVKDVNQLNKLIDNIYRGGTFCIGAEWTLRYLANNVDKFAGKNLVFEKDTTINNWREYNETTPGLDLKSGDRTIDLLLRVSNGGQDKFFEFKSVTTIPTSEFKDQFIKDLILANGELDRIHWIFDKKKLPGDFKELIINAIEKMEIPKNILIHYSANTSDDLAEIISKVFDQIFVQGK